jgi:hypothetical protein
MTFSELQAAVANRHLPAGTSEILRALYLEAIDDWAAAHDVVQAQDGQPDFDRLHAYLHRRENDLPNARYWYARVGEALPEMSLDAEWHKLAVHYCAENKT